jgi:5,10-methylenetetrahydromethanopterin reductase
VSERRCGVFLQGVDSPQTFTNLAREVEEWGYDVLWVTDSSLRARYPYVYLTLAAQATTRIRLGVGVTHPHTRHPALNLHAMLAIDELSGGRAVLGIGTGDRPVIELGHKPASVGTVRLMVETSRALLRGEHVTRGGSPFALRDAWLRFGARKDLPIYVAAAGPRMLELAGEVADGVIVVCGVTPAAMRLAVEHIFKGAARSGRRVEEIDVAFVVFCSVGSDRKVALDECRAMAAWVPATYPYFADAAGIPQDVTNRIKTAYAGGDIHDAAGAEKLTPDEAVRAFALAGTPEDVAAQVKSVRDAGFTHLELFPTGHDRRGTVERFAAHVLPVFCGSP